MSTAGKADRKDICLENGTILQPVVPCGNKVLQMIRELLVKLPPWVRFVFTTRPDAHDGQLLPALRACFPGMLELQPQQLKAIDASDAAADAAAEESAASSALADPGNPEDGQHAASGQQQVLVFKAVVSLVRSEALRNSLFALDASSSAAAAADSQQQQGPEQSLNITSGIGPTYAAYEAVFAQAC